MLPILTVIGASMTYCCFSEAAPAAETMHTATQLIARRQRADRANDILFVCMLRGAWLENKEQGTKEKELEFLRSFFGNLSSLKGNEEAEADFGLILLKKAQFCNDGKNLWLCCKTSHKNMRKFE
ncbi:hypothetical protein GCK72_008342 [Caenorhabditis remanei]|uniref:Uncharacterized protein n=1 Tax=Caenorhabditis remanei TaxID=31234 RepID=A0A6A5H005_CAERE|nr:hypothetical protein GCK72_008342 [Caenorhabditis remanei]KAF1760096.1 hypothetical protein GCK72_008342 [Caenorhabditis remanei]